MLCQIAHQFPTFVSHFLEQGKTLRRRFREETITDLLMGSLMTAGDNGIIVEFPNEPVTGADMEWNFVNQDDNTFFRILLQAKRAYGDGNVWKRHYYKELLHISGRGAIPQAVILCNTARTSPATFPLYILYHPERTCALAANAGLSNVTGVSLVNGYAIEHLVTASTTRALRTRNKSLGQIAPKMVPLSELFCPLTIWPFGPMALNFSNSPFPLFIGKIGGRTEIGRAMPPTPKDVREKLVKLSSITPNIGAASGDAVRFVPEVSNEIPYEIKNLLTRRKDRLGKDNSLNRWRVTFVSANPKSFDR